MLDLRIDDAQRTLSSFNPRSFRAASAALPPAASRSEVPEELAASEPTMLAPPRDPTLPVESGVPPKDGVSESPLLWYPAP